MPKIKFRILPPQDGQSGGDAFLFRCRTCKEVMKRDDIDKHAKTVHNATSAMVDTTLDNS